MPWFYVDDGFSDSKPVMNIPDRYRLAACGLWVLAGSWSAKEELDGFVPDSKLRQLGARDSLVDALCAEGPMSAPLWGKVSSGIQFKSWQKWQKTREELIEKRHGDAERQRKHRAKKKKGRNSVSSDDADMSQCDTNGYDSVTAGDSHDVVTRDPHARGRRPDPTLLTEELTNVRSSVGPRKRGTRLDPDWKPDPETVSAMRAELGAAINFAAEHKRFVDYWTDKTGQAATKMSWDGTWRNWMRRAAEQTPTRNGQHPAQSTSDRRVAEIQALKNQPTRKAIE